MVNADAAEHEIGQNMVTVVMNIQRDSKARGDRGGGYSTSLHKKFEVVINDSKAAVKNYAKGRTLPEALRILAKFRDERVVHII